jgi:acyl-CoA thioesterase FadM
MKVCRNDNDQYSHLNNSVYNLLFDTIINKYLVEECGLQASSDSSTVPLVPPSASASSTAPSSPIALVIESHASFFRPLSFPSQILLGLSVKNIGKSSVTYEVGVFGPLRAKAQSHRHSTPSTCSDCMQVLVNSMWSVVQFALPVLVRVRETSTTLAPPLPNRRTSA